MQFCTQHMRRYVHLALRELSWSLDKSSPSFVTCALCLVVTNPWRLTNGGCVPAAAEDVTGEVRSALAPSKPQRTASMRDRAVSQPVSRRAHNDNIASVTGTNHQHRDYDVGLSSVRSTSDSPVRDTPSSRHHFIELPLAPDF